MCVAAALIFFPAGLVLVYMRVSTAGFFQGIFEALLVICSIAPGKVLIDRLANNESISIVLGLGVFQGFIIFLWCVRAT